jgi:hypothetical protein
MRVNRDPLGEKRATGLCMISHPIRSNDEGAEVENNGSVH